MAFSRVTSCVVMYTEPGRTKSAGSISRRHSRISPAPVYQREASFQLWQRTASTFSPFGFSHFVSSTRHGV